MKKILVVVILTLYPTIAFSQEIVGNIILNDPIIKVNLDFYDDPIDMEVVVKIMETHLISNPSGGLRTVDDDISDKLMEVIENMVVDPSDFTLTWGYITEYCATKFLFKYQGTEYLIIHIEPEDIIFCFEILD